MISYIKFRRAIMSQTLVTAKALYDLLNSENIKTTTTFQPSKAVAELHDNIIKAFNHQLFMETEGEGTPISYKRISEKTIEYYITTGNVEKISSLINTYYVSSNHYNPGLFSDVGELSENPLLQARSMFICGITLYTRAAISGGLTEHVAYALSDNYIKYCLPITDISKINQLQDCALYDFTAQVRDSKYRKYGLHLRKCLEYISRHLHDKITLSNLEKCTGKSAGYISKIFQDEMGMRPIAYIRKEKLNYAIHALELTDFSVSALSDLLAFPSTSAFIKYFKEEYGCTPLEYKNRI